MIALCLRFPAGRYHATPWGRQVNEAALAWPPEPLRILRALIACHYRKADKGMFTEAMLANLIDILAEALPVYRLPEAVQAHTRHYMPSPVETTLVFDAFARFDPAEPLIIGWPGIALSPKQRAYLDHLAARLSYLGRAESWTEATVIEWDGKSANARPLQSDGDNNEKRPVPNPNQHLATVYAPLSPNAYRETRERLLRRERERRRAGWTKKSKPTDIALDTDMKGFLATLPECLADALAIETSDLQAIGWNDPPAARRVLYSAPEPMTFWRGELHQQAMRIQPDPTVARFVLAGRPRPRVEDTVMIAEIMRRAAMAKFDWEPVEGKRRPRTPCVVSGYGDDGRPLREDTHAHAFWLPEDADGDGEIDHVIVYAAAGLNDECRRKLDQIIRLWIDKRGSVSDDAEGGSVDRGRKEWRLALEGFGSPNDFSSASPLLRYSRTWISATPYLMPWHAKQGFGWVDQVVRELRKRGMSEIDGPPRDRDSLVINGRNRRPVHFHRFRSRGGLCQPDTLGRFIELTFKDSFQGPLALGFGCHFGLGLFRASPEGIGTESPA